MSVNVLLGPDAQVRFALQLLRRHEGSGKISAGTMPIVEGVSLSSDPQVKVSGEYHATKEGMLSLNIQPSFQSVPRWQAMHVEMGAADLSGAAVVGMVARSRAPASITTRVCIRSGRDEHFVDTFFPKTMVSFATPSTHLDVIEIAETPDLPREAQWRDLIFFFRAGKVELDLLDLRLFIV